MSDEAISSAASYTAKPVGPCGWRPFACGCERDDEALSSTHETENRSAGDVRGNQHHWPKGYGPKTMCITCNDVRPCACDKPKSVNKTTKTKGKKKR